MLKCNILQIRRILGYVSIRNILYNRPQTAKILLNGIDLLYTINFFNRRFVRYKLGNFFLVQQDMEPRTCVNVCHPSHSTRIIRHERSIDICKDMRIFAFALIAAAAACIAGGKFCVQDMGCDGFYESRAQYIVYVLNGVSCREQKSRLPKFGWTELIFCSQ